MTILMSPRYHTTHVILLLSMGVCGSHEYKLEVPYRIVSPLALKAYCEIVDEARPLSGFFPTHADLFTEMHF